MAARFDQPNCAGILMYHRVIESADADPYALGMCVTRQNFEAQLAYIKDNFDVRPLRELVDLSRKGLTMPARALAITFDDGYLDNIEIAAPLLRASGLPATFFIAVGGLDDGTELWWDRVIGAVYRTARTEMDGAVIGLPGSIDLARGVRQHSVQLILDHLWRQEPSMLEDRIQALCKALGEVRDTPADCPVAAPRMTRAHIRQLSEQGFEIGAHTVRHVNMRQLTPEQAAEEIRTSRRALQSLCGTTIRSFAYPSGFHSERLQQMLEAEGFDYAVSTDRGVNQLPFRHHALFRIGAPDTGISDFKRAVSAVPIATIAGEVTA
jgi:peptidoglycan/xylan/chitin deacetylase (PgdA/CDA1 family)